MLLVPSGIGIESDVWFPIRKGELLRLSLYVSTAVCSLRERWIDPTKYDRLFLLEPLFASFGLDFASIGSYRLRESFGRCTLSVQESTKLVIIETANSYFSANSYFFFSSSLLLNSLLTAFKPSYVGQRAMDFVNLITTIEDDGNSTVLRRTDSKIVYVRIDASRFSTVSLVPKFRRESRIGITAERTLSIDSRCYLEIHRGADQSYQIHALRRNLDSIRCHSLLCELKKFSPTKRYSFLKIPSRYRSMSWICSLEK